MDEDRVKKAFDSLMTTIWCFDDGRSVLRSNRLRRDIAELGVSITGNEEFNDFKMDVVQAASSYVMENMEFSVATQKGHSIAWTKNQIPAVIGKLAGDDGYDFAVWSPPMDAPKYVTLGAVIKSVNLTHGVVWFLMESK